MVAVPALLREAARRGWWDALADHAAAGNAPTGAATLLDPLTEPDLARLAIAPRVVAPSEPGAVKELLLAALRGSDATMVAAVAGDTIVGLAVAASGQLLALGVAPGFRRQGLAGRLLTALVGRVGGQIEALVTVAERDPVEPLDHALRASIARRLLERAGFAVEAAASLVEVDPHALRGIRR